MVEKLPLWGVPASSFELRCGRHSRWPEAGILGLLLEMLPLEKSVNLAFMVGREEMMLRSSDYATWTQLL